MEQDHQDPSSEGTQRAMERLMALGVLVEAGSRLAAENARSRANRAEQNLREYDGDARAPMERERLATAGAFRRARDWTRFASDGERLRAHLAGLPFQEVARHWGQAARHADTDRTAATVLDAAEDELRRRAPGLIDLYRRQREDGVPRREAMAEAARSTWTGHGPARPHGGRPPVAGELPIVGQEIEGEITRLADTLDPIARARLLHNLEDAGWSPESLAYVETLLGRAAAEHRRAATRSGTPDNPVTAVDEHQVASADAVTALAHGETDEAAATVATTVQPRTPVQVAAQSFPTPAQRALTPHREAMSAQAPPTRPTLRRAR